MVPGGAAYGRGMEDLQQVAAFVAVAEALHIGRAATALGLTRATVSGRLRRLEARVGMVLVDRSHRCLITLTPEGSALLPGAQELLRAGRVFDGELEAVRTGRRGVVRVALATERTRVVDELERAVAAVDEGWQVQVIETDPRTAARAIAFGAVEYAVSRRRLPATTRCGIPTPGPHRREPRDRTVVGLPDCRPVVVTTRRRWLEPSVDAGSGARVGMGGDARVDPTSGPERPTDECARHAREAASYALAETLVSTMLALRDTWLADVPMPPVIRARWRSWSRQCAARRENDLRRREERRLGVTAAHARSEARGRRRWLLRLWKGWARGDRDLCAYVDWMRERGVDPGLGMDPARPPRGSAGADGGPSPDRLDAPHEDGGDDGPRDARDPHDARESSDPHGPHDAPVSRDTDEPHDPPDTPESHGADRLGSADGCGASDGSTDAATDGGTDAATDGGNDGGTDGDADTGGSGDVVGVRDGGVD